MPFDDATRDKRALFLATVLLGLAVACPGDDPSDGGPDGSADGDADGDGDADTDTDTDTDTDADADSDGDGDGDSDADADEEPEDHPVGDVTGVIRVNHFGWRPGDRMVALVLGHPSSPIELHRAADASVAASLTTSALATDEDSGDALSSADFTEGTGPGRYYLYLPETSERSYVFVVGDGVYDVVGAAAMRSFYFQRCNHERALPHASDRLGGFAGLGGRWEDGACHLDDLDCPAGPGSPDHGRLDLRGGWHDAGDYQKTLWGRGVDQMLWAYELNPGAWSDGQLRIPESENGVPDILDELAWELDFYIRMQRPDGHFMSSVKGNEGTVMSPPSASDEQRAYFDVTSPSGGGWSGGGVTLVEATGNAVLSLAHAAIVFRAAGEGAAADVYRDAALAGWGWLDEASTSTSAERRLRVAAAAAIHRLDGSEASAAAVVGAFPWSTWDGDLPWSVTPAEGIVSAGAFHVLANPSSDEALRGTVREAVRQALVERVFEEAGAYGGLFGGPGNGWDWTWGSNRAQSLYGAHLLMAARFGALGDRVEGEVVDQASRYFHYMLGQNPLNMVYLTNMAAYGGEHSSFQVYHGWFSHTGGDGDHGNERYNGLPAGVEEPLYPYHPEDTQTSTYGPPPGLVPGGPNYAYGGLYEIPNRDRPAYAYRDWSVGCDWNGSACASASWEITEPMAAYQGPFVLLASFMMSGAE